MLNKLLSTNSPLARRFLRAIYREGRSYRVPFGPFRGFNLVYRKEIDCHAMLGLWELDSLAILEEILKSAARPDPTGVVLDVGANIGLYSLWFAKRMVPHGQVIAFEPAPHTRRMLEENLATNTQRAIRVEAQAAAAGSGTVDFFIGSHHHQSSLNADWASGGGPQQKITVPAVALDDYCARLDGFRQIAFIKMDIEGGGVFALGGCSALFRDHRPLGIVESHTPAEDGAISGILTTHEYVGFRVNTRKWITKPKETHPDPEGVWGTVLLVPKERRAKVPW